MPTSLTGPIGAASPDATRPTSITTSSAETPEPSICRLQRMHGPRSGIPWRSLNGGFGGGLGPGWRPSTAIRFWSLGQWNWYVYETALVLPRSFVIVYCAQFGSCVGAARDCGSV